MVAVAALTTTLAAATVCAFAPPPTKRIQSPVRRRDGVVVGLWGRPPPFGRPPANRPGGGGGRFPVAPVAVFTVVLLFPGFFLSVLNTLFLAGLVLPPLIAFGLSAWSRANTITAPCPRCAAPVSSFKDQSTLCFNCGTPLVPTSDGKKWRPRSVYDDDDDDVVGVGAPGVVSDPFFAPPPANKKEPSGNKAGGGKVIDVEAEVE